MVVGCEGCLVGSSGQYRPESRCSFHRGDVKGLNIIVFHLTSSTSWNRRDGHQGSILTKEGSHEGCEEMVSPISTDLQFEAFVLL